MGNQLYPILQGEAWPVNKRPAWSTIVMKSASGKEVRIPNYSQELLEFDVPYQWLDGSAPNQTWQDLIGFYNANNGPWSSFLFWDVTDYYTINNYAGSTAQNVIGTGDGTTLSFQLTRTLGGATRQVYDINGVTISPANPAPPSPAVVVYLNGVNSPSNWSVNSVGVITFTSGHAPGAGVVIAVDFAYFWRCRFAEDALEFSNFAQYFWSASKVSLVQTYS